MSKAHTMLNTLTNRSVRHSRLQQLKSLSGPSKHRYLSCVLHINPTSLKIKFDKKVLHYGSILPSLLTKTS